MNVKLSQHCLVSTVASRAIDVLTGEVFLLTTQQCERLAMFTDEPRESSDQDSALMEMGVLEPVVLSAKIDKAWRDSVVQFLSSHGALCVMPTEKCNLRCEYCYESFLKGAMSEETQGSVKRFLERTLPGMRSYSLAWFGGEPMLQPSIVRSISGTFRALQAAHGVGGSIAMTTNGTLLTPSRLAELEAAKIDLFHISVDGPKQMHDAQRRSLSGNSTYDVIIDNIENALRTTECTIVFRVNLKAGVRDRAERVSDWLNQEIVPRFQQFGSRLRIHVVSVWDASTKAIDGICITESSRFQNWFDVQRRLLGSEDLKDVASFLARRVSGLGAMACYAGKPNHYVVGSDGTLYKCTVAFDLPENQIGRLNADGSVDIDHARESVWTKSNSLNDPSCSKCTLATSCMGLHCPLTRIQTGKPPCPTEKRWLGSFFPVVQLQK